MDIKELLKHELVVAAHVGDMDACAAMVAFRELARKLTQQPKRIEFTFSGAANREGEKILKMFDLKTKLMDDVPLEDFEYVVLLDTQPNVIPDFLRKKKIFLIDHHVKIDSKLAGEIVDEKAASTTEIVYGLFRENKIKPSAHAAKAIIYGLISDTAGMRFAKTKTFGLMHELLSENKFEYQNLLAEIYEERDISERIAWLKAARRAEVKQINNRLVVISEIGAFESSSATKLLALGADVALVFSSKPGEDRVIGRAKSGINLAEIFTKTATELKGSGGGHMAACAMNVPDGKGKTAIALVLRALKTVL